MSVATMTRQPLAIKTTIIDGPTVGGRDEDEALMVARHSDRSRVRLDTLLHSPRLDLLAHRPQLSLPLADLSNQLARVLTAAKQELQAVDPDARVDFRQPLDSFQRMDAAVRRLIREYLTSNAGDWHKYVSFNQHHYVRHLIDGNDDYELMLLCWAPGQVSRVHNHGQSHCWLTCVDGEVVEHQYELVEDDPHTPHVALQPNVPGVLRSIQPCPPLKPAASHTLKPGETGYVNDTMCLHSVGCGAHVPAPGAVTLHLYVPPVRRVELYEPDENRVTTRVPGFFSVRGQQV